MLPWLLYPSGPPSRTLHDDLARQSSELAGLTRHLQEEEKRLATVEQELASLKQKHSPRRETLLQQLLDIAQGTGALLALLALVIYGAVRIANAAFYARLGVVPEEVGLSYSVILSRAIGSILLLLASIGLIVTSVVTSLDDQEKPWSYLIRFPTIIIGLAILSALTPSDSMYLLLLFASGIIVLIVRWRSSPGSNSSNEGFPKERNRQSSDSEGSLEDNTRIPPRLLQYSRQVWWMALVVIVAFTLSAGLGYQSAQAVTEGKPVDCTCFTIHRIGSFSFPWISGSAGFLGIQTERGKLEWVDGRKPENLPGLPDSDKMVYLGSNNGTVVVYDAKEQRSVRFPIEAVKVTVEPRNAILFFQLRND